MLTEYEQQRLDRIETNNAKLAEKNFAHKFLIRPSSHEEPVVLGENNIGDEVCILASLNLFNIEDEVFLICN